MFKVVLVWELGEGLGHVTRLHAVAQHLSDRGHSVMCVMSNPGQLQRIVPANHQVSYQVLQGPIWSTKPLKLSRQPANLAEVLLAIGYHKMEAVVDKIKGWRNILAPMDPEVIIYDFAPTAFLATKDLRCKKIGLDDPFCKPPNFSPLPSFNQDARISGTNLQISEEKLLANVNAALRDLQLSEVKHVYEFFSTDKSFLLSIPEVDAFSERRDSAEYIGILERNAEDQVELNWPSNSKSKNLFAYLKPSYIHIKEFLLTITQMDINARIFIPGATAELLAICEGTSVEISERPYHLTKNLTQCDLVICHGGHTTTVGAILNGVPLMIIPLQQEQLTTAAKCIKSGLALGLGAAVSDKEKIASHIQKLLRDSSFRNRAQCCHTKYQKHFQKPALQIVADYVESLL